MALRKLNYDVDASGADAEAAQGYKVYDGELPPKGPYRVSVKFMKQMTNKNNDLRLWGIVEIDEAGEKKKYNGYGMFYGENVSAQSASFLNAMLDALGIPRAAIWKTKKIMVDDVDDSLVVKIGTKLIEGIKCRVNTTYEKDPEGAPGDKRLRIVKWMPLASGDEAEEEWDEDAGDTEEEETEEEEAEEEAEEEDDLWTEEQLGELDRTQLAGLVRQYGGKVMKGEKEPSLIAKILELQVSGEEEEEEESPF